MLGYIKACLDRMSNIALFRFILPRLVIFHLM